MFNSPSKLVYLILPVLLLGGCASKYDEPPEMYTTGVVAAPPPTVPNGAVYQGPDTFFALFEDRRPSRAGDILTILLDEQVSASKSTTSSTSRSSNSSLALDQLPVGLESLMDIPFDMSGDSAFSGTGSSQANNRLTGTITVTVANVLPNGDLFVTGEKQIVINQGTEFIRFSGVVNPRTVDGSNTVRSSSVANARIQYTGNGYINESQKMGWMQRFFLSVSPF